MERKKEKQNEKQERNVNKDLNPIPPRNKSIYHVRSSILPSLNCVRKGTRNVHQVIQQVVFQKERYPTSRSVEPTLKLDISITIKRKEEKEVKLDLLALKPQDYSIGIQDLKHK